MCASEEGRLEPEFCLNFERGPLSAQSCQAETNGRTISTILVPGTWCLSLENLVIWQRATFGILEMLQVCHPIPSGPSDSAEGHLSVDSTWCCWRGRWQIIPYELAFRQLWKKSGVELHQQCVHDCRRR